MPISKSPIRLWRGLARPLRRPPNKSRIWGSSGIRLLSEEVRSLGRLKDGSFCILVAAHNSRNEGAVSSIKHRYEDVISTQIHNNLKGNKCLEIFLLSGSAERIRKMVVEFNANKKISGSKLIIA